MDMIDLLMDGFMHAIVIPNVRELVLMVVFHIAMCILYCWVCVGDLLYDIGMLYVE